MCSISGVLAIPGARLNMCRRCLTDRGRSSAAHLAKNFGATDPANAIQWAQSLEASARTPALISVAWVRRKKIRPRPLVRGTLPANDPARANAIKDALSYWILRDSGAANSFKNTLPEADPTEWH